MITMVAAFILAGLVTGVPSPPAFLGRGRMHPCTGCLHVPRGGNARWCLHQAQFGASLHLHACMSPCCLQQLLTPCTHAVGVGSLSHCTDRNGNPNIVGILCFVLMPGASDCALLTSHAHAGWRDQGSPSLWCASLLCSSAPVKGVSSSQRLWAAEISIWVIIGFVATIVIALFFTSLRQSAS